MNKSLLLFALILVIVNTQQSFGPTSFNFTGNYTYQPNSRWSYFDDINDGCCYPNLVAVGQPQIINQTSASYSMIFYFNSSNTLCGFNTTQIAFNSTFEWEQNQEQEEEEGGPIVQTWYPALSI